MRILEDAVPPPAASEEKKQYSARSLAREFGLSIEFARQILESAGNSRRWAEKLAEAATRRTSQVWTDHATAPRDRADQPEP
jgi:hypothetical protein